MQTSGEMRREIAKLYSFVARMSEARSGTALTPPRISLRSSGLQAERRENADVHAMSE
jgi:hypothetical protein